MPGRGITLVFSISPAWEGKTLVLSISPAWEGKNLSFDNSYINLFKNCKYIP